MLQANVLITDGTPPRARVSDFGLCAIVATASFGPTRVDAGGTIGFMAPELLSKGAKVSKEADMYAFGMMVYEVIAGVRPYRAHGTCRIVVLTIQGLRPPRPATLAPVGFGQGTWEFAEQCWDGDPTQRPLAGAALEHFERVAKTSTVVGPGPAIWIQEHASRSSSGTESSSVYFRECHGRNTAHSL